MRWYLLWSGRPQLRAGGRGCYVAVHCAALPGPWAARAIKDELVELLRKEGTTWREVVREAVERHSFREASPPPPVVEPTVEVLHQEAEELKRLLDGLGEKIEEVGVVESPSAGESTRVDASVDAAAS